MRILFIGQAPSRETDGKAPFTGRCGRFLAELLGVSQEQMLVDHDFINVLDEWPGKGIGGDAFPMPAARAAAVTKIGQLKGRYVVLLGNNVARAFAIPKFTYFSSYRFTDTSGLTVCPAIYIIPHPSGVNRHWNDPTNRAAASKFLRQLAATPADDSQRPAPVEK